MRALTTTMYGHHLGGVWSPPYGHHPGGATPRLRSGYRWCLIAFQQALSVIERVFSTNNLLVRIHLIIAMIRWTGIAPWEFEFPFPGSLTSTFLGAPSTCISAVKKIWHIEDIQGQILALAVR